MESCFIRAPNSGRGSLTCIVAGVMIAILVSCLQFLVAWHSTKPNTTLITDVQKYLDTYFADLKSAAVQSLPLDTCSMPLELTAARHLHEYSYVCAGKDKKTFCSSLRRWMDIPQ